MQPTPLHLASDGDLLRAGGDADDTSGFRLIYERHADAVYGYLTLRVGPDTAQDLTSETFATAWLQRRGFRAGVHDARPWLLGIATVHVRRYRRRERSWQQAVQAGPLTLDATQQEVESRRLSDPNLAQAVARLTPGEREVLLLATVLDAKPNEIAEILGASSVAVRVRLHRARTHIVALLEGETK